MIFFCNSIIAQNRNGWVSKKGTFGTHYFIENKGQFDDLQHHVKNVLYSLQDHDEIYFTKTGFTFHLVKMPKIEKEKVAGKESEEEEEKERARALKNRKEEWVEMNWLNANPNVDVIADEKSNHYFTYGAPDFNSYGYKRITYKNLYNGIDVIIELHPKGGIKYSVIANSAAALKQYQFQYSSANKYLTTKLINNQLYLINQCDTLLETELIAHDEAGNNIKIQYQLNKNKIAFEILNSGNENQKIIIDPWVAPVTTLSGTGGAYDMCYDVDFDSHNNLFVYGGGGGSGSLTQPIYLSKVAKYDNLGNLLWTFMGAVASAGWYSLGNDGNGDAGNFVVDKLSSKVYVSQGFNINGAQVIRLNAAGNYDNFISVANTSFLEIWELKFNCSTGELIGMGGATVSNSNFGIIDTTTGALTTSNVTGLSGSSQDIANAVIDNSGNPYLIFADGLGVQPNNYIYKLNSTYTTVTWNSPTNFTTLAEANNKPYVYGFGFGNSVNVLAVNKQYIFYYDGYNLEALNAATGSIVGSPIIVSNNFQAMYQAGIVANDCNEVFVGGDNGDILKYQFNGSVFTPLSSINIPGQSNRKIHDIMYNSSNQMLYACGDSFVAVVSPQSICVDSALHLAITTSCPDSAIVSVVTSGASAYSYTFTWIDSLSGNIIQSHSKPLGTLHDTLVGIHLDSIIKVTVVRNSPCQIVSNTVYFILQCNKKIITICNGSYYTLSNGKKINLPGNYPDTLIDYHGIYDSIIVIQLKVFPLQSKTIDAAICSDQNYLLPNGSTVTSPGVYSYTYKNKFGCDSIVTINLTIDDCEICKIAVPSAFTPNGDGFNDKFRAEANCIISQYDLAIYNRWGQKVFESKSIDDAWDGTFNGVPQPSSVFVYYLSVTKANGELKNFQGNVSLLR